MTADLNGLVEKHRPQTAPESDEWQADPLKFPREVLGCEPWPIQEQIIRSVWKNPVTAVRSCHGSGKSWTGARLGLDFLYSFPNSVVITTAPTGRQVRKILWQEIHSAFSNAKRKLPGALNTVDLNLGPMWMAYGFSTDNPDSFQGPHAEHVLLIVDEAPGIIPGLWVAFDGILTSEHTRLLAIGNPTEPSGRFYDLFRDPTIPPEAKIRISAFDTPNFTRFGITREDIKDGTWQAKITGPLPNPKLITPAWVADKYRKWGPDSPMYASRVEGNFPEAGEKTLIPLSWVEAAEARWETMRESEPREIGVDVARFGGDESVLALRAGRKVVKLEAYSHQRTTETAGKVIRMMRDDGASMPKVDVIGLGAGVVDEIIDQGRPCVGVNVAWAALEPEKYVNFRAEMFWSLREQLDPNGADPIALPLDEELKAQLTSIRYDYNRRGQIIIESKEDMKKRGLPSPDRADAVALAFVAVPEHTEEDVIVDDEHERISDW